jgi:hypothetical protein
MQTLFESHPKLKNSLNTMPPAERNKVDFTDWEVDAEGFVSSVETVMPEYEFEDKLLWADSGKNSDAVGSSRLVKRAYEW